MKMWQRQLKDVDLIFIVIQALIPTLKYRDQDVKIKDKIDKENIHSIIGRVGKDYKSHNNTINASSISEVSGIPRSTKFSS